jgi:hypothetical protein
MGTINFDNNDEPIVVSKYLMDLLIGQPHYLELCGLYMFYYYTAKWQKTNQVKATNSYVAKGIGCSEVRLQKYKAQLIDLHLIENIIVKDANESRITGHYIKVNFIWAKEKLNKINTNSTTPNFYPMEISTPNALSSNKQMLPLLTSSSKFNKITPIMFHTFWKLYPKKTDQGKAKTAWDKLCKKKDVPDWNTISNAIYAQKESERWQEKEFIPMPSTWINQSRWLDDPKEMIIFKRTIGNNASRPPKVYDGIHYNYDPEDGFYKNRAGDIWVN